jgi:hypothetical protein
MNPSIVTTNPNTHRKVAKLALAASSAFVMFASFFATDASAQGVNLTGQYTCIQGCLYPYAGQLAFITQDGWELNLVSETGEPSRAWVDWPGHIWAQRWNEGAVVSPDGMVVQFDRGQVWQRYLGPPPVATTYHY